jgi:hypothetical protein
VREWEREQGRIQLLVRAGAAVHPETGKLVNVGLPFGPKPRLILAFLNTQAILTDSYRVEVEVASPASPTGLDSPRTAAPYAPSRSSSPPFRLGLHLRHREGRPLMDNGRPDRGRLRVVVPQERGAARPVADGR